MSQAWPILSLVTFLPLLGAALHALSVNGPKEAGRSQLQERRTGHVARGPFLIVFLLSLLLWARFDRVTKAGFQFEEKLDWVPALNIGYHLGIDGISLFFVLLATAADADLHPVELGMP